MSNRERDLFDALREADPATAGSAEEDTALRQNIRRRVLAAVQQPVRATSRRRVLVIALLTVAALAVTAAAFYLTREPSDARGISCYQEPSLDTHQVVVDSPLSLSPSECETLWIDGTLTNPAFAEQQVPPLIGCVNDIGGLGVFPSNDTGLCEHLGLAGYEQPANNDTTTLHQRILDLFPSGRCTTTSDAQLQIEEILSEMGFNDWSVRVSPEPSPERPCASLSFDAEGETVLLVPIPPD
jgi:hypothetical protein